MSKPRDPDLSSNIYEMLIFHYLALDPELSAAFDEDYITRRAVQLGNDVVKNPNSILFRKI